MGMSGKLGLTLSLPDNSLAGYPDKASQKKANFPSAFADFVKLTQPPNARQGCSEDEPDGSQEAGFFVPTTIIGHGKNCAFLVPIK